MDLVSPHPYWPLKDGLVGVYPSLHKNVSADIVVLGAGISGALVAERLAREGLNVVVIDKREAASGSTSASTALLQYDIDTPLIDLTKIYGREDASHAYRLCHDAIDELEKRIADEHLACDFQKRKSVLLASTKSDAEWLHTETSARLALGIEVEYWDKEDIIDRFSFAREAALVSTQAAEIDPYKLTHALLAQASTHGARIFDRTPVTHCDPGSRSVRLTTDQGFTVEARHVVFATGYESRTYLPHHLVQLKSTFAFATEPLASFDGWWEHALIWETARPYLYLRTTADGRALVGGEDDPFRNPARRDLLLAKKSARLEDRFRHMFSRIPLEVAFRWAGTFGETKDGLPYIGSVRQMPRCFFALGYGGNGIVFSVLAADIIRDAILERPNSNARLFRFDR